jgi:formylglycine-generating enzyme required for sulfatase activity
VQRGGAFRSDEPYVRAALRNYLTPDYRFNSRGFRCVVVGP